MTKGPITSISVLAEAHKAADRALNEGRIVAEAVSVAEFFELPPPSFACAHAYKAEAMVRWDVETRREAFDLIQKFADSLQRLALVRSGNVSSIQPLDTVKEEQDYLEYAPVWYEFHHKEASLNFYFMGNGKRFKGEMRIKKDPAWVGRTPNRINNSGKPVSYSVCYNNLPNGTKRVNYANCGPSVLFSVFDDIEECLGIAKEKEGICES